MPDTISMEGEVVWLVLLELSAHRVGSWFGVYCEVAHHSRSAGHLEAAHFGPVNNKN